MKKLLFIIIGLIVLTSCDPVSQIKEDNEDIKISLKTQAYLKQECDNAISNSKPIQLIVKDDDIHYLMELNEASMSYNIVRVYDTTSEGNSLALIFFMLGIVFGCTIGLIVESE